MRFHRVLILFVLAALPSLAAQAPARPNIVMFIMDDLGYGDLGSYGAPDAKTPNIDRIAREGIKLTDFYANASNCSPTRTGFITGRYQQRVGIESPIPSGPAGDGLGLPPSETSLPRLLKNQGYATGMIGKWHLGKKPEWGPNQHGFDEFWGFLGGALDYYTHEFGPVGAGNAVTNPVHDLFHNGEPTTAKGYLTDEIVAHARAFIEAKRAGPFFAEIAFNATHWPFQWPDLAPDQRTRTDLLHDGTRAEYVAILERADRGIGEILTQLDRLGLTRNTIVIFTSDNGGEWLSRNAPLFHRK